MKIVLKIAAAALLAAGLSSAATAQLRAGAAKVEITPDASLLPAPYLSIHDPLYTRAILIDNGKTRALLMNLDLGKLTDRLQKRYSAEISSRYGIPVANIVISAVHDHASVPDLGEAGPGAQMVNGEPVFNPQTQAFIDKVHKGMLEAVEKAQAALEPAEMGYGEGKLLLNVNRDGIDPKTRQWAETPNHDFPSDKTLYVLEFRRPGTGEPIGVYMSYAMHAVTMFMRREISGDFPGVASKYIEDMYDQKAVALWAVGPAGDQDPLYLRVMHQLGEEQIKGETDPNDPKDAGAAMLRLFRGGTKRPPVPLNQKLAAQSWQLVQAIGTLTAEEALRVMDEIPTFSRSIQIAGSSDVVSCPARKRNPDGTFTDSDTPAKIQTGALRLGDTAIAYTDSEIYNKIGLEARDGSPFRHTMVINLANGDGGYIPTDDAYGRGTFQVAGNRIKQGCAEMGIVRSIDGQLNRMLEGGAQK